MTRHSITVCIGDGEKITRRHVELLTKSFKAMFDIDIDLDVKRYHTSVGGQDSSEINGKFTLRLSGTPSYNAVVAHRFKEEASRILRDKHLRTIH